MKLIHEIFLDDKKIFPHAVTFLMSALLILFTSTSTSPLYNTFGDDSAIFQAVGFCWANGLLPYVDVFENKGPLIFLIDAVGYSIAPRTGIMLLQIPAMFVSMTMAWRALGMFLSGKMKIFAAAFTIIFYTIYSIDGNRTEEWSMPFLMTATYFFLRGLKENSFPARFGLICGVGFGACVMLRATNALPICCEIFLTAIFLLRDRDFKTLRKNILMFVVGAAAVVLPFVMYFAAHGALYEMLYGTILLNVAYTAQRGNFLLTHLNEYAGYVATNFLSLYLMIIFGTIALLKKKSRLAASELFCGAMMLLMLFKLSPYFGYCALITPLIIIFFAMLSEFAEDFQRLWTIHGVSIKRTVFKFAVIILMMYPLLISYVLLSKLIIASSESVHEYYSDSQREFLRLKEIIPPDERDSVMIWGEGTQVSHWVLETGIVPRCRFFGNVRAFSKMDPAVKAEWLNNARHNPPRWIIYCVYKGEFTGKYKDDWTKHFRTNRDADVERVLDDYELVDETEFYQGAFRLYELK